MAHLIGQTRNGIAVYVDLIRSDAAKHIARQPRLLHLMAEVLRKTSLRGEDTTIEHDLGQFVGFDHVVQTSEKDTIFYAQLSRDTSFTRFTKNGKPIATQVLTLFTRRNREGGGYTVYDMCIGKLKPPRPGSDQETDDSKAYWQNHAIVYGEQLLQPKTVTKECPY